MTAKPIVTQKEPLKQPRKQIDLKKAYTKFTEKFNDAIYNHIILKIKGYIIHSWIEDFEDQYLKTFKPVAVNVLEAKVVINNVYKRMSEYKNDDKFLIFVKYNSKEGFSISSTQSVEEIEYAEFQKWKKLRKGGK